MKIDSLKIKLLLAEMGITQTYLASICGVSRQNISTILMRGTCSYATAGKLSKALGVPVRWFIRQEETN